MNGFDPVIVIPLLAILVAATVTDWLRTTIPNVLTFGGAVFAFVLLGTLNGWPGIVTSFAGWCACLIAFLPLYARGGMAAGDVKLMATVGAFLGPITGLVACAFTLIAGGAIAVACLARYRFAASSSSQTAMSAPGRYTLKARIPYAGAIAAGTSLVVLVPSVIPSAFMQLGV